jgi:putative DNA primase/helicase
MSMKQLAAARYLALGWTPIPLSEGKGTKIKWAEREFALSDFSEDKNVGLALKGGLVDLDVDNPVSQRLLSLMPKTASFGRKSVGVRHLLYQVVDPVNIDKRHDFGKLFGVKLDLRTCYLNEKTGLLKNILTMVPPSIHPDTNEELQWFDQPEQPTTVSWQEIRSCTVVLAVATEFLRVYEMLNGESGHHQLCMSVAGVMYRVGWPIELAYQVLEAVMEAAGERDIADRRNTFRDTYDKEYDEVTGIPTLSKYLTLYAPNSQLIALLTHEHLPFPKSAFRATEELCEVLDVASLEDYDLGILLHKMSDGKLVHHQKHWYMWNDSTNSFQVVYHSPIEIVAQLADVLKAKLEHVTSAKAAGTLRKKIGYCRSTRGMANILRAAQCHFEAVPLEVNDFELLTRTQVVDVRTGEARPRGMQFTLQEPMPTEYDPNAKCPLWDRTIHQCMLGDKESMRALQMSIGMALLPTGKEERLVIWKGSGANGKTKVMNALRRILGKYVTTTPIEVLAGNQFRSTSALALKGTRIAYVDEFKNAFNAGLVKQLTGGGTQSAYVLAQGQEEFQATWTVFLMTNEMPHFNKFDDAIARRLFLIEWKASFKKNPDLNLEDKLVREAPGVLNWCIEGCRMFLEQGALVPTEASLKVLEEEATNTDTLGLFFEEKLAYNPDGRVRDKDLRDSFRRWCSDNNIFEGQNYTAFRFYREFESRFPGAVHGPRSTGGQRFFQGIEFRIESDESTVAKLVPKPSPSLVKVNVNDLEVRELLNWLGLRDAKPRPGPLDAGAERALDKLRKARAANPLPDEGLRQNLINLAMNLVVQ